MVTLAAEELEEELFYYRPDAFSKIFRSNVIPLRFLASAIHNEGYTYSLSHGCAGAVKTNAPMKTLLRIHKAFHHHPELLKVKHYGSSNGGEKDNASSDSSIPFVENEIDPATGDKWVNFRFHPDSVLPSSKIKLVRYQENPTSNWGPGTIGKRYSILTFTLHNDISVSC